MNRTEYEAIVAAYEAQGKEAIWGKGGVWVKGEGFRTLAQARKETGVNMKRARSPRVEMSAYGDWATVAAINGIR